MRPLTLVLPAVALGLSLAACGGGSAPTATVTVTATASAQPVTATTASAPAPATASAPSASSDDATLSCAPVNDPLGTGALGSGPTAQVTLVTITYIPATTVQVTVIDFDANGAQTGTSVINFTGPMAAGQMFTAEPESTDGNTATCEIATVNADVPFTYYNASPVS